MNEKELEELKEIQKITINAVQQIIDEAKEDDLSCVALVSVFMDIAKRFATGLVDEPFSRVVLTKRLSVACYDQADYMNQLIEQHTVETSEQKHD